MKRLESDALWTAVDDYISEHLATSDDALDAALAASEAAGLPKINIAPNQGKLLWLLARALGARRILEIGTLGGYSAIWLARGLAPDGRLVTIEANPDYAEIARANIARAGLEWQVELHVGTALKVLPALAGEDPFDLVFIDADKPNTPDYFQWALKLSRPGALIVVDNVVREGAILDQEGDANVQAMRCFFEIAASEQRVSGTALQTVGSKGHDGLAIFLVTGEA